MFNGFSLLKVASTVHYVPKIWNNNKLSQMENVPNAQELAEITLFYLSTLTSYWNNSDWSK